jgi:pimeloyl-ACP methyl ester carboxylesterase
MARLMAERIPNSRHVVIPGVGHMSNVEAPAAVNEILRGCQSAR